MELATAAIVAFLALIGTIWTASRSNPRAKEQIKALGAVRTEWEAANDPLVRERLLSAQRSLALRIEIRFHSDRTTQVLVMGAGSAAVLAVASLVGVGLDTSWNWGAPLDESVKSAWFWVAAGASLVAGACVGGAFLRRDRLLETIRERERSGDSSQPVATNPANEVAREAHVLPRA